MIGIEYISYLSAPDNPVYPKRRLCAFHMDYLKWVLRGAIGFHVDDDGSSTQGTPRGHKRVYVEFHHCIHQLVHAVMLQTSSPHKQQRLARLLRL